MKALPRRQNQDVNESGVRIEHEFSLLTPEFCFDKTALTAT
ncbi:MAG: hypothetical protein PUQ00_25665 [Nostoc sp. S13]|nr:hypothetical protein [Nostoc sp. S13]